jgi:transcriptional regulator with XRE-family HTH domain
MDDFAAKLTALMQSAGLSQNQLAKLSGVPQTTISAYASRKNAPSWEHVQSLSRALGVSCEELRAEVPPPKKRKKK